MSPLRPIKRKARARAIAARLMFAAWICVGVSVVSFALAPPTSEIATSSMFPLNQQSWMHLHFQLCNAAVAITLVHIVLDRRAIISCIRYLGSSNRNLLDLERQLDKSDA